MTEKLLAMLFGWVGKVQELIDENTNYADSKAIIDTKSLTNISILLSAIIDVLTAMGAKKAFFEDEDD